MSSVRLFAQISRMVHAIAKIGDAAQNRRPDNEPPSCVMR